MNRIESMAEYHVLRGLTELLEEKSFTSLSRVQRRAIFEQQLSSPVGQLAVGLHRAFRDFSTAAARDLVIERPTLSSGGPVRADQVSSFPGKDPISDSLWLRVSRS